MADAATATAATAAAVEDLFLRGEYAEALAESQAKLAQRTLELRQELRDAGGEERAAPCITSDEERVLSIYLQAVFELDAGAEVETATAVVDAFAPLPVDVAVQWVKFLVAMQHRAAAESYLRQSIEKLRSELRAEPLVGEAAGRLAKLAELLAVEFVLEKEGADAALRLVRDDPVLDDITRLKLVGRVEERAAVATAAADAANSSATTSDSRQLNAKATSESPSLGRSSNPTAEEAEDCSYALIGGTAIAVAVAAVGAIRYRDKIGEALSQVAPAISKGIADAKYALFDA